MIITSSKNQVRGAAPRAALPLIVGSLVTIFGFLALSIDLGLIAVVRTQAQNMADSAAMAGARTLNGTVTVASPANSTQDKQNNNYSSVATNAQAAAVVNKILGNTIDAADSAKLKLQIGTYTYFDSYTSGGTSYTKQFVPLYPSDPTDTSWRKDANSNWGLVRTTVTHSDSYAFAGVFNLVPSNFTVTASAMAAHRPRDVAIIMDMSGSMRYDSLIGVPHGNDVSEVSSGNASTPKLSNNPDDEVPTFGHYSDSNASLRRTTAYSSTYGITNFTKEMTQNDNRTRMVSDYYRHVRTPTVANDELSAWSHAGTGDSTGLVAGDKPWKTSFNSTSSSNWAKHVTDIVGSSPSGTVTSNWMTKGYDYNNGTYNSGNPGTTSVFKGYSQGPGYWGKSFFMWPPDPRTPVGTDPTASTFVAGDWRKRFFQNPSDATRIKDNNVLWDSSGNWRSPSVSGTNYYRVDYAAIINWIKNIGPNPFPSYLQAGRVVYYSKIPDHTDSNLNARMRGESGNAWPPTDVDERFWKDYIDYVLGTKQINSSGNSKWDANVSDGTSADLDGSGSRAAISVGGDNQRPSIVAFMGYGDDFQWSSTSINAAPGSGTTSGYMSFGDHPRRPREHFWFGPLSLVDFLGNHNLGNRYLKEQHYWFPGTAHESPSFACKIGLQSALQDIQKNHPNDHASLILFSHPKGSATDGLGRRFNRVVAPMGRNYTRMLDGLWFPPYTLDNPSANINMYEYDKNAELPRPVGGTCYSMPLMLAFNQFSTNTNLRTYNPSPAPSGDAGGLGRKGAQKMIIFETDGEPNVKATKALTTSTTAHNSYYPIRYNSTTLSSSEFATVSDELSDTSAATEANDICQKLVANETSSNGYGTSTKPVLIHCIAFGSLSGSAPSSLTTMETTGNIPAAQRIGSTTSPYGTSTAPYKLIGGTETQMQTGLRNCIQSIMQDGVQVSLLE